MAQLPEFAPRGRAVPDGEELAPEFALYFGSNVGAGYQAGMWLPYLDRIGRPYIVITRTLRMMRAIAALTEAPVVHRPTLRSLEEVVPPSLKVAFYVNNAVKNTHFIERREMRHVWLNHGDSEKPACYNPVHAIYDHIFSAGQAGVDRYARHGVEIPGRSSGSWDGRKSRTSSDAKGRLSRTRRCCTPRLGADRTRTRLSYSLPSGRGIVEGLLARGCTVIFRAHPFNYRFPEAAKWIAEIGDLLAADAAATGRQHIYGKAAEQDMSVVECFNASDAMVSDVSAMVSDYLQSGKPFSIVSVGRTIAELEAEAPASRAAYVIEEDLGNLDQALDNLLVHDPLAAQREESRVYYLGDFPAGNYADGFLNMSRETNRCSPETVVRRAFRSGCRSLRVRCSRCRRRVSSRRLCFDGYKAWGWVLLGGLERPLVLPLFRLPSGFLPSTTSPPTGYPASNCPLLPRFGFQAFWLVPACSVPRPFSMPVGACCGGSCGLGPAIGAAMAGVGGYAYWLARQRRQRWPAVQQALGSYGFHGS